MYASYIKTYLGSQIYWGQLYANSAGTGQPNVNATTLKSMLAPIPPIEQQHRIVSKVNELMTLCDTLLERIKAAQTTQLNLTDAIAGQAVG